MPTPNGTANSDITRPLANFKPCIWGDRFLQYDLEPLELDETMKQIIILKEKVSKMLVPINKNATSPLREVILIDVIQRLGLCYHFEQEIGQVLQHIYNNCVQNGTITLNEDIHYVALVFRLLRQHGYHISSDVFKKFKNEQGNFIGDVEGMLSLYEATHMRIHGEDILDEAFSFTSSHLGMIMTTQLSPSLALKTNYSLKWPLFKNLPRLVARNYISIYEEDPLHDTTLLLLGKLDFNVLQKYHQKDIGYISKWWNDLDVATNLPFARNRLVEGYFWVLGVNVEPQYFVARRILTKVFSIVSMMDDIYDSYGTIEELQLFTLAMERWDISCIDSLPQYMQFCYKVVLDVYEEVEEVMVNDGRASCFIYAKNEMIKLAQAYFTEAQWLSKKYVPTMEEYMALAMVNSGYYLMVVSSFIGMKIASEEVFQWVNNKPKIVDASSTLARLMSDIGSHEFEQKRGHGASAVECYMKQHGVSRKDAVIELSRQVTNAWKDMNKELVDIIHVPKPLLIQILNWSRCLEVIYKDGEDYYTHPEGLKNDISSILLNPFPITK